MKRRVILVLTILAALVLGFLLGFGALKIKALASQDAKSSTETAPAPAETSAPSAPGTVTMDAATQQRLGLQSALPEHAEWRPEFTAYGQIMDPSKLLAAVVELRSLQAAAEASGKEYGRVKQLAAQDNISARAVETAQAADTHDRLSLEAMRAQFAFNWGRATAEKTNLDSLARQLSAGKLSLVRIVLPAGRTILSRPAEARLEALEGSAEAELLDATDSVDPQTQERILFYLTKNQPLPANEAVTAFLQISGSAPEEGLIIPHGAVLRYEGKTWIYTQAAENLFARRMVPLDRPIGSGWFVVTNMTSGHRIVIKGAEAILSTELNGGGFTTGERD